MCLLDHPSHLILILDPILRIHSGLGQDFDPLLAISLLRRETLTKASHKREEKENLPKLFSRRMTFSCSLGEKVNTHRERISCERAYSQRYSSNSPKTRNCKSFHYGRNDYTFRRPYKREKSPRVSFNSTNTSKNVLSLMTTFRREKLSNVILSLLNSNIYGSLSGGFAIMNWDTSPFQLPLIATHIN